MMLTKEECEKALDHFEKCYWDQDNSYGAMNGVRKDLDVLNKLIHEHFDNPPLKFEELKEGMWVWDDIDKEYRKVYGKGIYLGDEYLMKTGCKVVFISEDEYFNLIYEPNRFYRKEVKDV